MPVQSCSPALRAVFRRRIRRPRPMHLAFRGDYPPDPPTPPPNCAGRPRKPSWGGRGTALRAAGRVTSLRPWFTVAPPVRRPKSPRGEYAGGHGRRRGYPSDGPHSLAWARSGGLKAPAGYRRGRLIEGAADAAGRRRVRRLLRTCSDAGRRARGPGGAALRGSPGPRVRGRAPPGGSAASPPRPGYRSGPPPLALPLARRPVRAVAAEYGRRVRPRAASKSPGSVVPLSTRPGGPGYRPKRIFKPPLDSPRADPVF